MRSRIYTILFILWIAIILILTSIPKLHNPLSDKILNIDKLAHLIIYLIFAFLFTKMNKHKTAKQNATSLIYLALFVPLLDELHQIPIPGRTFSYYDMMADTLGFLVIIIYNKCAKPKLSFSLK
ncbi:MAG: VanZ family protein [Candidatus Cloacimonetes bacterium]|nr:VanZ family protein [Candidatus Cloacimonadota bacterium]